MGIVAVMVMAGIPAAAAREPAIEVRMSGMIAATWEGSAARGCAATGTCGTTGSAVYRAAGFVMELEGSGSTGGLPPEPVVVRVRRQDGSGPPSTCVDVLPRFTFPPVTAIERTLSFDFSGQELSAGRCAGPRPLDLLRALPSAALSLRAAARRPRLVDMSARRPFTAGSFSGQVISTLRARVRPVPRRASSGLRFEEGPDFAVRERTRPRRRHGVLRLLYRAGPVSGAVITNFRGRLQPTCAGLGACGTRGTSSYELAAGAASVELFAWKRQRHGPARKGALLRALRRGTLEMEAETTLPRMSARVVQSVAAGDGARCTDSVPVQPPELVARRLANAPYLSVFVRPTDVSSYADALRTHCPGPTQADVLPGDVLARARIDLPQLGQAALPVVLRPTAPAFLAGGYSGERGGAIPLDLRLVAADARIEYF